VVKARSILPGLIFAGKARSLPKRGAPGLYRKYSAKTERLASDINSSLFGLVISDEEKKFYKMQNLFLIGMI
jgi:hypothetical protein